MIPVPQRHVLAWPESGVEMAFRLIPSGSFRMGSRGLDAAEEPTHRVQISEAFWMAETPVTRAQFAFWTETEKIEHENKSKDHPEHPAENLDWRQAMAYCEWLTRTKGNEFPVEFGLARLPTEAEWEYACQAGTESEYYTGDGEAALAEAGWFDEKWAKGSTHPVGQKVRNASYLYDSHGNVWEWCRDVYDPNAYRKRMDGWKAREWTLQDGGDDVEYLTDEDRAAKRNQTRVLRGGSWHNTAKFCRSACRFGDWPDIRDRTYGFRVCLVCGPVAGRGAPSETAAESDGAGAGVSSLLDLASAKFSHAVGRKGFPEK